MLQKAPYFCIRDFTMPSSNLNSPNKKSNKKQMRSAACVGIKSFSKEPTAKERATQRLHTPEITSTESGGIFILQVP